MKVEKISKKFVKPITPTPQSLKNYKISFADKQQWPMDMAFVLFYESKPQNERQLEESLSKTLVQFYLLAGRYIKNDHLIDCNDEGAEFVEARALNDDVVLMNFVAGADAAEQLKDLLPDNFFRADEGPHDPLLSIQATHFPCGGLSIAISVSHRVFDASSLNTFMAAWSSVSCDAADKTLITPSFHLPSLLPCKDSDFGRVVNWKKKSDNNDGRKSTVVKRLVFTKEGIASLKSKTNYYSQDGKVKPISNARIVSAVVAKGLTAIDNAKHGRNRDLIVFQPVNMRERTIPPQPNHTCGNLSFTSVMRRRAAAADVGIEEMVALIGAAARNTIAEYAEITSPGRDGRDIIMQNFGKNMKELSDLDANTVVLTDLTTFGFYEADFGFGKPVWITTGGILGLHNNAMLMRNRDGDGIEAWLQLDQNDMPYFNQVEEYKRFAI